jgi:hypothetical protein
LLWRRGAEMQCGVTLPADEVPAGALGERWRTILPYDVLAALDAGAVEVKPENVHKRDGAPCSPVFVKLGPDAITGAP